MVSLYQQLLNLNNKCLQLLNLNNKCFNDITLPIDGQLTNLSSVTVYSNEVRRTSK